MSRRRQYFQHDDGDPTPLAVKTERRVRFEEVDVLGMVWHGRYPSYFEDGRIAFGDKYGLTYHTFRENMVVAPVVRMLMDYKSPLRFDESFTIETALYWAESARLNFDYTIYNKKNDVAARGYTVQLLTDPDGTVILIEPEWLIAFKEKWRNGHWQKR